MTERRGKRVKRKWGNCQTKLTTDRGKDSACSQNQNFLRPVDKRMKFMSLNQTFLMFFLFICYKWQKEEKIPSILIINKGIIWCNRRNLMEREEKQRIAERWCDPCEKVQSKNNNRHEQISRGDKRKKAKRLQTFRSVTGETFSRAMNKREKKIHAEKSDRRWWFDDMIVFVDVMWKRKSEGSYGTVDQTFFFGYFVIVITVVSSFRFTPTLVVICNSYFVSSHSLTWDSCHDIIVLFLTFGIISHLSHIWSTTLTNRLLFFHA